MNFEDTIKPELQKLLQDTTGCYGPCEDEDADDCNCSRVDYDITEQELFIFVHKQDNKIFVSVGDWCPLDYDKVVAIIDKYTDMLNAEYGLSLSNPTYDGGLETDPFTSAQDENNWITINY